MNAGEYNRYVEIQKRRDEVDDWGSPIKGEGSWVEHCKGWANIGRPRGKKFIAAGTPVSEAAVSIVLRGFRTDIDAGMRVVYKSTVYQINVVLPDFDEQADVDLVCASGVPYV